MTASITGRKRCFCGQYLAPLANGTLPRHTAPFRKNKVLTDHRPYKRERCQGTGKFPPATVAERKRQEGKGGNGSSYQIEDQVRPRGGHRGRKRDAALKARYRRNSAGGYNR